MIILEMSMKMLKVKNVECFIIQGEKQREYNQLD